jgi:hypothetical protein
MSMKPPVAALRAASGAHVSNCAAAQPEIGQGLKKLNVIAIAASSRRAQAARSTTSPCA